jgi:hypothetical protein
MNKLFAAVVLLFSLFTLAVHAEPSDGDKPMIAGLLHGMFDKTGETLIVEPVVVSGDHAIADWTQGQMGGRALLRRREQSWTLILCAGDGIKSKEALGQAGVPGDDAQKLEAALLAEEARLPQERIAMFSRFEGMVRMDGQDGHDGPAHHH